MLEIEKLYGVEVIVHVEPQSTERKVNGLIQPKKLEDWIEGTVILTGNECKKGLKTGDKVVISKDVYKESPILTTSQFTFPINNGTFHIMTEYLILMKVKNENFVIGTMSKGESVTVDVITTKRRADL